MALVTIRRSPSVQTPRKADDEGRPTHNTDDDIGNRISKSLNECYFANKGAALVLGGPEQGYTDPQHLSIRAQVHPQPDIQYHLQSMFYLLNPEETLKMAVKLESAYPDRTRYLVVVCHGEEAALLGIDCNERTTVGLVIRVLADTSIKLDGDGGFSVCVCNQQHIFKPVSVQAMWSALQTLHRVSGRARELNHFAGGTSHSWCIYYDNRVDSDRSCLNEWHTMDSIESRRPPSPNTLRLKPHEKDETECVIRCKLKEIMMSVDLDEVTSKVIRGRLEDDLDMDLAEYKSFIDHEMLTILGQMDAPTEVFEHVYLGSEWNASNLEELQRNGVRHILNVTREIDNFFPGMFDYLNIRVYDDDRTDLLKHWDNTFKYIHKAKAEGSKVLVHCKMGISRSASVVIAYAMKAYNWNFDKAWKYVKDKRNCIKPNMNFISQLETYQGILDAMKNKEKLQRSKSETNLKLSKSSTKIENKTVEPTPLVLALTGSYSGRPRSWSPDTKLASELLPPTSVSLENLSTETRHMLMPCANGSYSVSPNQIIRLKEEGSLSVKHIVNEIENASSTERKELIKKYQRLNFGSPYDGMTNNKLADSPLSPISQFVDVPNKTTQHTTSPLRVSSHKYPHVSLETDKIHTWDPGETLGRCDRRQYISESDNILKSDSGIMDIKTKVSDVFTNYLDRNLDYEDRRVIDDEVKLPSRQSSWSSFDSAVVPDLSRHSSWGSYDTRTGKVHLNTQIEINRPKELTEERLDIGAATQRTVPDLGIINEHIEIRHKNIPSSHVADVISDNERKFNETCAILKELESAAERIDQTRDRSASTWSGRLSASAPAETWLRLSLRRRRLTCASHGDLPRVTPLVPQAYPASSVSSATGFVSNLKKEFEARFESDNLRRSESRARSRDLKDRPPASPPSNEDLSVKVLVDRYDQPSRSKTECISSELEKPQVNNSESKKCKLTDSDTRRSRGSSMALRNSFCGSVRGGPMDRPPIAPTVVSLAPIDFPNGMIPTVMSKAQNKKQIQHGKTHPLTRLNRSNRCSNPVYNTM